MSDFDIIVDRVLTTKRFTRWHVFRGRLLMAAAPATTCGATEEEATAWARQTFRHIPAAELRVVGVR